MKLHYLLFILPFLFLNCSKSGEDSDQMPMQLDLPTLTTSTIQGITQNSAQSGGSISDDGGAPILSKGVCWALIQNPTIQDEITQDGSGDGQFTSTLENLSPNTTYYLRAYATNSEGTSYGEQRSFTTLEVEPKIFTGDIVFLTQEEVDDFGAQMYDEITGNVVIGDQSVASTTTIANLEGLSTISAIGGSLTLHGNDALTDIGGLRNLETIGGELFLSSNKAFTNVDGFNNLISIGQGLRIVQNTLLMNLNGFSNLTEIGNLLLIFNNDELVNIDGLNGLISVGFDIGIRNNDKLSEINAFNNLQSSTGLSITDNSSLMTINGFSTLKIIQLSLDIKNNSLLTSFNGLGELESVGSVLEINNNSSLTSLDGLIKLNALGTDLIVTQNTGLSDLCGLTNLINNGFTGGYEVTGNAFNPSQQDIIDGNCNN